MAKPLLSLIQAAGHGGHHCAVVGAHFMASAEAIPSVLLHPSLEAAVGRRVRACMAVITLEDALISVSGLLQCDDID